LKRTPAGQEGQMRRTAFFAEGGNSKHFTSENSRLQACR
jgi:hypothetical protein